MSTLTEILGGTLVDSVKGFVEEFHLSPEKKAEFQAAIDANRAVIDSKQIEYQEKQEETYQAEVAAASANIRAEAQTGDKYTSRARPSFIYVTLVVLLCNYTVFPALGKTPVNFPDALFWLFGSCVLGYTGARSWDKWAATNAGGGK